jgi:hypothetical protein
VLLALLVDDIGLSNTRKAAYRVLSVMVSSFLRLRLKGWALYCLWAWAKSVKKGRVIADLRASPTIRHSAYATPARSAHPFDTRHRRRAGVYHQ